MPIKRYTITQADGSALTVTPNIADTLAFEAALRKNKGWGGLADNGIRLQTYRAWSAAVREGQTSATWLEFTEGPAAILDVSPAEEAEEEAAEEAADLEATDTGDLGKDTRKAPLTA